MRRVSKKVAVVAGKAVVGTIKYSLYVTLLLVGRVLVPLISLAIAAGVLLFLFCLLFLRDRTPLLICGACAAVGGTVLQLIYYAALRLVAPEGAVIVSEL
ncbi:hypothetical protein [Massilia orientalis]|uniref:Uncharacterized protein n=1 Tax=Massilia orientalis TaxID=3050128 RepID=A0ACC7MJ51_9BURK|nr:hypothetical protein [Massilia sp. YIM B02787]